MNYVYARSPFAEETPPSPRPPRMPLGGPPRVPVVAQYLVLGAAVALTGMAVTAGALATVRRAELLSWMEGPATTNSTLDLLFLLMALTVLVQLAALLATGWWLLGIRKVAEWAAPSRPQRRSSYWAVLGWIVPVVNLWFPYQVVADASRALRSRVRSFWPWWIAWLFAVGPGLGTGEDLNSVRDLSMMIFCLQLGAVATVIACVLWWRVVRSATAAATAAVRGDTVES